MLLLLCPLKRSLMCSQFCKMSEGQRRSRNSSRKGLWLRIRIRRTKGDYDTQVLNLAVFPALTVSRVSARFRIFVTIAT